jgi:hypothetical protein
MSALALAETMARHDRNMSQSPTDWATVSSLPTSTGSLTGSERSMLCDDDPLLEFAEDGRLATTCRPVLIQKRRFVAEGGATDDRTDAVLVATDATAAWSRAPSCSPKAETRGAPDRRAVGRQVAGRAGVAGFAHLLDESRSGFTAATRCVHGLYCLTVDEPIRHTSSQLSAPTERKPGGRCTTGSCCCSATSPATPSAPPWLIPPTCP